MMRLRSRNPVLTTKRMGAMAGSTAEHQATYGGVILKSAFLIGIVIIFAMLSAVRLLTLDTAPTSYLVFLIASPIIALIAVIIAMTKPHLAMFFSIIYAIAQGTFVGMISAIYEFYYSDMGEGIVATALMATMVVFLSMLLLYTTGLFKVTDMFRRVMFTALMGLFFTSFIIMILYFTGVFNVVDHLGFLFIIVVISVIVAALFLMLDFDNIQQAVQNGVDKQYEWVLSLGLLVTLIWLYIELLRLIAILRSQRR